MFNKSVHNQQVKKKEDNNLRGYGKIKVEKQGIEVKDIKQVLKSVLPELKREKISRSESCF